MPSVVEVMVEAIHKAGTSFITGIPGEESLEMIEAARLRGMRYILVKQENAGAFMSATWGEISGAPGVCMAARAPGAANITLGVAHAWMDRCPLIAITDQYPASTFQTGLRHCLDTQNIFRPITKWNATIDPGMVRRQMRRAIRVTTADPPGPVQFDMPADVRGMEAGAFETDTPLVPNIVPMSPDRAALKQGLDLLAGAKKPIILAGIGVLWSKAWAEMVSLAERIGAPVLTTPKSKGVIPEDHVLSAGAVFGGRMERRLIKSADLIIAIGLDPIELQPVPWPYRSKLLSLSRVASADGAVAATAELVGDLPGMLRGLAEWGSEGTGWGERAAKDYRDELTATLVAKSGGMSPQRAIEIARSVTARDAIATCDVGASRLFSVPKFPVYAPYSYFSSNGIASMGYALPAAMAARYAFPDRQVLAFSGDGSILMAIAELQTSVRENLPVTIVVLDNSELGVMRVKQDLKNFARYGTQIGGIDWEKIAAGFGADGVVVETENALGDAVSSAVKSGRTTLVAAKIDASSYVDQYKAMRGAP